MGPRILAGLAIAALAAGALPPVHAQVVESWVERYDGPAHVDDGGHAIAVDAAGLTTVAGFTAVPDGTGTAQAIYLTVKHDLDGTPIWLRTWAPTGGHCRAKHVAIAPNGDIVVTGFVAQSIDWGTIVYDPSGNVQWSHVYTTGSFVLTEPEALAVDAAGNVYITGDSAAGTTSAVTVKYGPTGVPTWIRSFDGATDEGAYARDLAVDAAGNVYIAGGMFVPGAGTELALWKYDASGTHLWTETIGTTGASASIALDIAWAMAIAPDGNIVVTGELGNGTAAGTDIAVAKFSPAGDLLWLETYDDVPNESDVPRELAVTATGDIIVAGTQGAGFANRDVLVLRYDPAGNLLWTFTHAGEAGQSDAPEALVVDADGAAHVVGYLIEQAGSPRRYFTVKVDAGGNLLWERRYGAGFGSSTANAVALGPEGTVHVTGQSSATATGPDVATVVYRGIHFRRGDIDGDGLVDIADPIAVLGDLFSTPSGSECAKAADTNDDGLADIADPVYLLTFLFSRGSEPPAPFADCGLDPTEDALDCAAYAGCP